MAKKDVNKDKKKNNFFKEVKTELKKVTWPTFKKLVNNTLAVVSIVLILSAIVFILDVCFENLNKFGVEKLKSVVSNETQNEEITDETGDTTDEDSNFDEIDLTPTEESDNGAEENQSEEATPEESEAKPEA